MTPLALAAAARSDVGRVRTNNEDAVFASPRLVAVADGVGGAAAGEVASETVIGAMASLDKRFVHEPLAEALREAVAWGNDTVGFIAACRPETAGMSTTLTAVALTDEGYVLANVGDSRTYLLRDGRLARLSRDDSYVQQLVDDGVITEAQARTHPRRSMVLAALDGEPGREATVSAVEARLGDRLLLCSDGLTDFVDEGAIAAVLRTGPREACAERLIELALNAGGRDNVSAVVADVVARRDPALAWG